MYLFISIIYPSLFISISPSLFVPSSRYAFNSLTVCLCLFINLSLIHFSIWCLSVMQKWWVFTFAKCDNLIWFFVSELNMQWYMFIFSNQRKQREMHRLKGKKKKNQTLKYQQKWCQNKSQTEFWFCLGGFIATSS